MVYSLNNVIMPSSYLIAMPMLTPNYQNLGQLCQCNCVRVHQYAYPQHIKVLKHFIYIHYGYGKQSAVVWMEPHTTRSCWKCTNPPLSSFYSSLDHIDTFSVILSNNRLYQRCQHHLAVASIHHWLIVILLGIPITPNLPQHHRGGWLHRWFCL